MWMPGLGNSTASDGPEEFETHPCLLGFFFVRIHNYFAGQA